MEAHVEKDILTRHVKVWIWQPRGRHSFDQIVAAEPGGEVILQTFEDMSVQPPPSFILPEDALKALVAAASDVLPPSDATVDALKDARVVRDRLLTLVEQASRREVAAHERAAL